VPLFDEHDEFDKNGQLVRRFDQATLEEICRRSNNRELATGDLSPFGPGHTIPDQYDANRVLVKKIPETDQPPIWGYFRNYRVAPFGPQGKLAIQCEMWAKKEFETEAKEYPRRSVELWLEDGFIDWVALLKRTPRRDLGLLTNARTNDNGQPVSVLRYSMGAYAMPGDPTGTMPQATDLNPEEMAMCDRMIKYMAGKGCFAMPGSMSLPAAMPLPQPIGTPPPGPPAANPAAPPAPHPGPPVPLAPSHPPEPKTMGKSELAETRERFERENGNLKSENAQLGVRLMALEKENRLAVYERDLTELANQGYAIDVTEELTECEELNPEAFSKHKARIVAKYVRDPSRIPDLTPLRGNAAPAGQEQFTTRHLARAETYMRDHPGCAWEEARSFALNEK